MRTQFWTVQQPQDGVCERSLIALRQQWAVFVRNHLRKVADIGCGYRQSGCHCFDDGYWHLFGIGGQSENVQCCIDALGLADMPGKSDVLAQSKSLDMRFQTFALGSVARDQ